MPNIDTASVLDCPMDANDADASTVREYLSRLLAEVWTHADSFSGKRPFGNSDWQYEVYDALVDAGLLEGTRDEDGFLDEYDASEGEALILAAIEALGAQA
jgi:hypothetical protein